MNNKVRRSDRLKKKVKLFDPSPTKIINNVPKLNSSNKPTNSSESKEDKEDKEVNQGVFFSIPDNESSLNEEDTDEIVNWDEFIAATSTKNYMMDDGFLDVLQNKSSTVIKANPDYSKEIGKMISLSTNTTNFISSLMNSGNAFETKVIALLIKELGENNVKDIGGNHCPRSTQKYRETITALNDGVPCIFQAILRNYDNKTYGVADILIRSDWINKFLDVNALSPNEVKVSAPNLKNPNKNFKRFRKNKNVEYHYVVIDIKYKTLPLRSDGIHLRNDAIMKAYKSQLWIYNDALSKIQGYCPPYAFILGSKWKYICGGKNFEGTSCFERLGRIDYAKLDNEYIEKTELAIDWLNTVRKDGDKWDLSKYPLPRDELYPNMCNRYDYPYHGIKRTFAELNSDLTLLWNVGPKQRKIAKKSEVYTWKDPRCTPEVLGVNGKINSKILRRILEANHSESRIIYPKYISNNFSDWQNKDQRKIELFVDFETTCPVFNDMEDLPFNKGLGLIFLIGAGYIDPKTKKWIFHKFVVNSINEKEENRICFEFINFVESLKKIEKNIVCFHWGHHEETTWKKAIERGRRKAKPIKWIDLLKVFKCEPIGIKGTLNYGLKNVAKTFHKNGFIKTIWSTENSTCDGADAAVEAYRANLECSKNNTSFANHSLTLDIIKYNEIDCKVLQEILHYLRDNHIDPDPVEDIDDIEDIDDEFIVPLKKRIKNKLE